MYGFSTIPPARTCRLCPAPISNYAQYCPRCMDELRHARTRVLYTVLKHLEAELPGFFQQLRETK